MRRPWPTGGGGCCAKNKQTNNTRLEEVVWKFVIGMNINQSVKVVIGFIWLRIGNTMMNLMAA